MARNAIVLVQAYGATSVQLIAGKRYSMIIEAITVWSDGETRLVVNLQEVAEQVQTNADSDNPVI